MPRQLQFTQEIGDQICEGLANGLSMRTICKAEDMPCLATVYKWLREADGFADQYARAKQDAADAMAEDMHAIADDESLDPNSRRIRVDTRKWIASKLKPKVYGDRVQLGGDSGAPLVVSWLGDEKL